MDTMANDDQVEYQGYI